VGNEASLNLQVNSSDLHELELLSQNFGSRSTVVGKSPSPPWELYGTGQFTGQVTGTTKDPHLAGQLSASTFQIHQSRWRSLRANLDANSRSAAVKGGELIATTNGQIRFDATVGLYDWSYVPSSPLTAHLQASGLQASAIRQLANLSYPISGTVSADVTLAGSQLEPRGEGVVQLANAKAWDEAIQMASVNFEGTGQSIRTTLKLQANVGNANGSLVYTPRTEAYELSFDARADNLSSLTFAKSKNIQSQGPVIIVARGRGTLKDPQLQASMDVPQLSLGGDAISGIKANLKLDQHRGDFEVISSVSNAAITAHGSVDLRGGYNVNATLDTRGVPLNPIFTAYSPSNAGVQGVIDLHATLKGPLKEPSQMEATVEIPNLKIDYQAMHLANFGPIRVSYKNASVELARSEIKGTDTDIRFEGTVPLQGTMNVSLRGDADLKLLMLVDKQTDSAGELTVNLNASGDRTHPKLDGNIRLANATYSTPTSPLGVENVNGEVTVTNNRFEITKLTGKSGGGDFTAHGYMVYAAKPVFNLGLDARTIRLRYPEGLRAILNGQLALDGSLESANLNGTVTVERLSFTQQFDVATFASQFGDETAAPPSEGFTNNIQLNVAVQSSGDLGLQSTKLSLQGDANLHVVGTAARPVITGRANITDGEVFFLNNRYHVERAVLEFSNPVRTEPVVNLLATTKVNNFDLNINMVGPIDRLRTSYVSDPPLPPVDIINLLTRGTTTEAAPANLGANSLIAKGLASQVSSRVGKLAGISSLQIDPLIGAGNRTPSARVAIQEHITKEIIFTYAADVTSTQNELIQVEYQVTPTWSLRVLRDETGSFSVEGRRRNSF
jgi:translocation and assembly module TamB